MDEGVEGVRRALAADSRTVARLLADFNAEYDEPTPAVEVLEERFNRLLSDGSMWALIAGDPPVGFATISLRASPYYEGEVALLEDLWVREDLRGQGIGASIIRRLWADAAQAGVSMVEVGVDEPDVDALRFYERHGFVHRDPDSGDRAYYLYRELDD